VYAPALSTTFTATRGGGAYRNGRPIRVSPLTDVSTALVSTGFSYRVDRRTWQSRWVANLIPHIRDIRRLGAASLDLCNVACGRVDAYVEDGLGPWDLAAGQLIAVEAGAVATDWAGGPITPAKVFVSAPGIATELRELVRDAMQLAGDRPD
jgi:myo-inositol-1(or 4)-monophosphatase